MKGVIVGKNTTEALHGLGNDVRQEPSVTICLQGMRKANCEVRWRAIIKAWLHITHILTPTWFICPKNIWGWCFPTVGVGKRVSAIAATFDFMGGAGFCSAVMFFPTRRVVDFSGSSSCLTVYLHLCPSSFLLLSFVWRQNKVSHICGHVPLINSIPY